MVMNTGINMNKKASAFLIVCGIISALLTCSASVAAKTADNPLLQLEEALNNLDPIIGHTVYETASGDEYTEYTTVYYGDKKRILSALTLETQFDKSAGYTKEMLDEMDIDEIYPGFSSMSCSREIVTENEDTVSLILVFRDLDELKNSQEMVDYGFLYLKNDEEQLTEEKLFDADSIMQDLEENGAKLVDIGDYKELYILKF